MLIRPILALLLLGALLASARAQLPSPYVQAQPPVTAGNCAKWYSNFSIADAGKTCGGSAGGCANQLVLDYSNSCALIGQGWGQ